ncbi:Uncharacterized protein Fot_33116 [Forsythia ovata]|uniref:Uncharacterized protein n=1 Tax=Forsythia ovata TaxID=205694 RepID=A0ABD1T9W0_9LAMI
MAAVDDIFGFIESSISIASLKRPEEFMSRRWRIAKLLYGGDDDLDYGSEIESEPGLGKKIKKPSSSEMRLKLEESKKKLQERYKQIQKGRSKIQIIDIKNLPPRQDEKPKDFHRPSQKIKRQSDLRELPRSKFNCDTSVQGHSTSD